MDLSDLPAIIAAIFSGIAMLISAAVAAYIAVMNAKLTATQKDVARVEVATNSMKAAAEKLISAVSFDKGAVAGASSDPGAVEAARTALTAEHDASAAAELEAQKAAAAGR